MPLRLDVTENACADLDGIWGYIAQDNPSAADRLMAALNQHFSLLCEHPGIGRACLELAAGMRRSTIGNYLIFYVCDDQVLRVLRVLHGARDIETVLHDE